MRLQKNNCIDCIQVINPATEEIIDSVPVSRREDLDLAVYRARQAQRLWAAMPAPDRYDHLKALTAAIRANAEELSETLVMEQGRPIAGALHEVEATAKRIEGLSDIEIVSSSIVSNDNIDVSIGYRPMGVVGAISPWNFPLVLSAQLMFQAIIAGNGVVLKPSEYTPLTAKKLVDICATILPEGLVGLVQGDGTMGRAMCEHPSISMIGFIGSTDTGKQVMAGCSGTLKRLSLELGGNDAAIVLKDADIDKCVPGLFRAAFTNSGQICMGVKRIYTDREIHDDLVDALAAACRNVVLGNGMEPETTMGPLQNEAQYKKVIALMEGAIGEGGTVVCGGKVPDRKGYFLEPTIMTDLPDVSPLFQMEQFGPVLPVGRFDDLQTAIDCANGTPYGLGASVWCTDEEAGHAVAGLLEAGTVWVNQHAVARADTPFGGVKQSGFGRALGKVGITSYMETCVLNVARHAL